MTDTIIPFLEKGSGFYTINEVAWYAQIPKSTLQYWFMGRGGYKPVREGKYDSESNLYFTFNDLLEARAIRKFRAQFKVNLSSIRDAVKVANENWGIDYPLSNKNYQCFASEKEVFIRPKPEKHTEQISGRDIGQTVLKEVFGLYDKIKYDDDSNPIKFNAGTYEGLSIELDPKILMGQPRVENIFSSAPTIWRSYKAENDEEFIAQLYDIDERVVKASCSYCDNIGVAA